MQVGKLLIYLGLFIVFVGFVIWIGGKIGIPFGRLPGDISVKKEKYTFFFPIVTCILISIFLTIFLNLIFHIFKK